MRPIRGLIAAFVCAIAVATPNHANAATFSYVYTGAPDTDCAVQVLGGPVNPSNCEVVGSFKLQSELFGGTQHALDATFSLFVNGVKFDDIFFAPFVFFDPFPFSCISYCNEVETDAAGNITRFDQHIFPPSAISNSISLSESIWGWDNFETGNGLSSSGSATIGAPTPVPIPLPGVLPLFVSGMLGIGVIARRRRQT